MNGSTDSPDSLLWLQNPVDINNDESVDLSDLSEILNAIN